MEQLDFTGEPGWQRPPENAHWETREDRLAREILGLTVYLEFMKAELAHLRPTPELLIEWEGY